MRENEPVQGRMWAGISRPFADLFEEMGPGSLITREVPGLVDSLL
jgi:hypothetical protein